MAVSSVPRRSTKQKARRTAAIRHLLGYVELVAGRLNRAREQAAAAVQDAKDAGDQLTYAHATSLLFLVDFLAGSQPSEDALADALALEQATDAGAAPDAAERRAALRLMYLDRLDEARETFGALRRAANRGDEEMVEAVRFHSARLELRAGDWTRAAELTDQISELAGQTSDTGPASARGSERRSLPTKATRTHRHTRPTP